MKEFQNREMSEKVKKNCVIDFKAKQNLVGFFNLLLEVAKRDPEIWERICKEKMKIKNKIEK